MSLANPPIQLSPEPLKPVGNSPWKRRGSEEDKDESNMKKPRCSWYVTLESESSKEESDEESDNESIYSVQGQETEYARDTSDTSTWMSTSEYHQNMSIQVEYDVESLSESDNPFLNVSSSDPEDILTVDMIANLSVSDLDHQQVEDTDESCPSVDSEISKADYWSCVQCNMKNNNPLFRYCERCYQLRKNFFPPRPKPKKKHQKSADKSENETVSEPNSQPLSQMDSGLGSMSQGSQQSASFSISSSPMLMSDMDAEDRIPASSSRPEISNGLKDSKSEGIVNDECNTSSGRSNDNLTGLEVVKKNVDDGDDAKDIRSINLTNFSATDTISVCNDKSLEKTEINSNDQKEQLDIHQQKIKSDEDGESKLCLVCTVSPKNGAFVHGNVLHICCCYRCAIKVWKTTKHCPICKRKVTNVLKAFYV